jgi:hypothetical protein
MTLKVEINLKNKSYQTDIIYKIITTDLKRKDIVWPLPDTIKLKPLMTELELKEFCSLMKPGNIYFEFGAGGSTNIASYYKVKSYSVESDANWHQKLKNLNIETNYITVDLKAHYLGYPGNQTNIEDWKKYIQSYKSEYNANLILIN